MGARGCWATSRQGQLDALREFRETGECAFPFPLFPEPGGVLPWGDLRSPGVAYWLTGPGDPDEWPVIVATEDGGYWERLDGCACEFLAEVAAGRYDASRFPDDYEGYDAGRIDLGPRPVFGPAVVSWPQAVQPVPLLGRAADFWPAVLKGAALPVSEMAELRELLGAPSAGVAAVDWAAVHARLGVRLPADYRQFVNTYGPGALGDIQIMAPGAPGRMDLFELLERKYAQVRELSRVLEAPAPFYPQPAGTVCWGEALRGARSPAGGPAAGRRAAATPRNGAWSSCRTRTWRAGITKTACRSAASSCVTCGRIASPGSRRCATPPPGRSRLLRTARVPQPALGDRQRQWTQTTRGSRHGANVDRREETTAAVCHRGTCCGPFAGVGV